MSHSDLNQPEVRASILQAELGREPLIGTDCSIRNSELGYACEVGDRCKLINSSLDDYSYISDDSDVINSRIGKFCSIAAHTRINPGNHPLERAAMHHFTYRASRYGFGEDETSFFEWRASHVVEIGHDVWLGHGVVVLPGVKIGNGAAVGAGTIVTKDIPPFAIVVGNPGRIVRMRFSEALIERLERLAWWHWSPATLADRLKDFRTLGTEAFVDKYLDQDSL